MRCGFTNGQSKTVMYDIVALVRQNCLCDKHNLRHNVYVKVFSGMYCPLYIYKYPKNLAQVHIVRTIVVAWLLKSMSTPKCLLTPRTQTAGPGQVVPSHLTALSWGLVNLLVCAVLQATKDFFAGCPRSECCP